MTSSDATKTADLILITVGVAAAYVIITTPRLRRLAARALTLWLGASIPEYLIAEVRRAWAESGQAAA